MALPFLGPIGGAIGAVAGTVLGLGKVSEESSMWSSEDIKLPASRAILAEAALQSLMQMEPGKGTPFLLKMKADLPEELRKAKPVAASLGPSPFLSLVQIPSNQASFSTLAADSSTTETAVTSYPDIQVSTTTSLGDAEIQNRHFVEALTKAASKTARDEELPRFIESLAQNAVGVEAIDANAIGSLQTDRESSKNESVSINTTSSETAQTDKEALYQRALVADATLAKVLAAPPELYTTSFLSFLSEVANTAAQIAPTVLNGIGDVLSGFKGAEP